MAAKSSALVPGRTLPSPAAHIELDPISRRPLPSSAAHQAKAFGAASIELDRMLSIDRRVQAIVSDVATLCRCAGASKNDLRAYSLETFCRKEFVSKHSSISGQSQLLDRLKGLFGQLGQLEMEWESNLQKHTHTIESPVSGVFFLFLEKMNPTIVVGGDRMYLTKRCQHLINDTLKTCGSEKIAFPSAVDYFKSISLPAASSSWATCAAQLKDEVKKAQAQGSSISKESYQSLVESFMGQFDGKTRGSFYIVYHKLSKQPKSVSPSVFTKEQMILRRNYKTLIAAMNEMDKKTKQLVATS
ncbi:MAG: hypothetical protein K2P51_02735 [Rhabdochlamydiaceae bacterium]|nr:hypothetical protein [Rhabdochlamydiaceae bacterium]